MTNLNPVIHVDQGSVKHSVQTRIDGGNAVGNSSAKSALYASSPTVKSAADAVAAAGKTLTTANDTHSTNKLAAKTSGRALVTATRNYDKKYTSFAVALEDAATIPEDVTAAGAAVLEEKKQGLVDPIAINAKQDGVNEAILVRVKYPKGTRAPRCVIEVSPTPATPASYVRSEGDGVKRTIPVPGPGVYAVHAATVIAGTRGTWFGPVNVTIK